MAGRLFMGAAAGLTAAGVAISTSSSPSAGEIKAKAGTFIYKTVVWPVFAQLGAEQSHNLAVMSTSWGLTPFDRVPDDPVLNTTVFGMDMRNPLGLAAGCDKNGAGIRNFLKMGFGFVEIGSVTPEPQPGNPQPRMFRLFDDGGAINRYGFNSDGADSVKKTLEATREGGDLWGPLGVNLGKNKTAEALPDYVTGVTKLGALADYLVINVSSPNTPGLRTLQKRDELGKLMKAAVETRDKVCPAVPVLVKIAPDLTDSDIDDICAVVVQNGVDGMIVTNTTNSRPPTLTGEHRAETGGLSGLPLKDLATEVVRKVYVRTEGKVPLVGVGGVGSGQDAYDKIRAGASLVQMYTRLSYEGPYAVPEIKRELAALLKRDGFASVAEAVGADAKAQLGTTTRKSGWF